MIAVQKANRPIDPALERSTSDLLASHERSTVLDRFCHHGPRFTAQERECV